MRAEPRRPAGNTVASSNFPTLVTGGYDDVDLVIDRSTDVYRDAADRPKFAGLSPAEAAKAVELADLAKMEGVRARVEQMVQDHATAEALRISADLLKQQAFHDRSSTPLTTRM